MFKKNFLLLCALTAAYAPVVANAPECFREDEIVDVTKGKKCCKCCSLTVTNNATIGGNLTVNGNEVVRGSVTASSFITPSGGALLNWGVLANESAVTDDTSVLWDGTTAGNLTAGIVLNPLTGAITLPTTGTFLVQFTVRIRRNLTIVTVPNTAIATTELRQSVGGVLQLFPQAVVSSNTSVETIVETGLTSYETQITGYALMKTTSAANNVIDLRVFLNNAGVTIPLATAPDANANMTIIQLA